MTGTITTTTKKRSGVTSPTITKETTTTNGSASTSKTNNKLTLTRAQVLKQADPDSLCLLIINDKVYDVTKWQDQHPGGHLTVRALSGKDATDSFTYAHPKYVTKMLSKFFYADLALSETEEKKAEDEATRAFRSLTQKIEQAGLFETDYTFYYKKLAIYGAMFGAVVAGVVCSGDRPFVHLLSGILLGMFWQQTAFIGHDIGHNSITHDRIKDSYGGLFVGNFMSGISMAWWKRSHNAHHIVTNSCDYDPDIQHLPVFAIDPVFVKSQKLFSTYQGQFLPTQLAMTHLLVKYQHFLYYPVMMFARFNLYIQSINHALGLSYYSWDEHIFQRGLQIASLVGFWTWLIALTMYLPTWYSRLLFFAPAHMVAGILHVQITLSHFCMPAYKGVTYDDASNGYLRTQLQGSMNVDCPTYMDWFHGGLQFQVEHHLWPRLPRHNLRTVKKLLMALCLEHGLEYHQATFYDANRLMLSKLKQTSESTKSFSELFKDSWNLQG